MQTVHGTIVPEIGYHIAKTYQRHGYATEAARAVRNLTFTGTPFGIVYSYMKKDNVPSSKTALANGMRLLEEYTDEEGEETVVYGITRAEWQILGQSNTQTEPIIR